MFVIILTLIYTGMVIFVIARYIQKQAYLKDARNVSLFFRRVFAFRNNAEKSNDQRSNGHLTR